MLIEPNSYLYCYAVTRDYGFAPNPFFGKCTLATCKPKIRKSAQVGDWVLGIGGAVLNTQRRKCIYIMKISEIINFDRYWNDPRFQNKKPSRNGSRVRLVGDNIYHSDSDGHWMQEDSHHSNNDGTPNPTNVKRDTATTDRVLISEQFLYFGKNAVSIDLESLGYGRVRDIKKYQLNSDRHAAALVESIMKKHINNINQIQGNPVNFDASHMRVDQKTGRLI